MLVCVFEAIDSRSGLHPVGNDKGADGVSVGNDTMGAVENFSFSFGINSESSSTAVIFPAF